MRAARPATLDLAPGAAIEPAPGGQRVLALDALRGFDMFWIIGGQELALSTAWAIRKPSPEWLLYHLEHPEWLGFSAWDLIMPLFLFVVGAAMPFSFARRRTAGQSEADWRRGMAIKIVRRTLLLFVLGMIVQGHLLDFDLSTLHPFANTLQAIAVGYLVSGFLMLYVGIVGQLVAAAALLVGYWLLMTRVPFGAHPAGTLLPDANMALAVDEFILGRFRDGTAYTWILSGMTFTVSVLLGVQSGHALRAAWTSGKKLAALVLAGGVCLALGYAWAEWGGFPIIKHVWTSSMTLWAAGWSFLLLALFYLLIDMAGWRKWAFPLVVIGANALVIYVAFHLIDFFAISKTLTGGLASHLGSAGPVLEALSAVLLAWLVVYHLYRQKIFLRV
jgi:predicted acyltransferase